MGILLDLRKMNTKQGARKVALLSVICRPGRHLDFKMKMFHKSDMDFAGGELGQHISVEGPANHTNHSKVLFLGPNLVAMTSNLVAMAFTLITI